MRLNTNTNFTSRFPSNGKNGNSSSRITTRTKSIAVNGGSGICLFIKHIEIEGIDGLSVSSFNYKGYKYGASRLGRQSSRLSNYSWIESQKHGIVSPDKQDFGQIFTHSFVYDNLNNNPITKRMNVKKVLPKVGTKASKLRDDFIKNYKAQIEMTRDEPSKNQWKMRQFLEIGPHDDIAESIKRNRKLCKSYFCHFLAPNRAINQSAILPEVKNNDLSPVNDKPYERVNRQDSDRVNTINIYTLIIEIFCRI